MKLSIILFTIGAISFVIMYLFLIALLILGNANEPVPFYCKIWMGISLIFLVFGAGLFLIKEKY